MHSVSICCCNDDMADYKLYKDFTKAIAKLQFAKQTYRLLSNTEILKENSAVTLFLKLLILFDSNLLTILLNIVETWELCLKASRY